MAMRRMKKEGPEMRRMKKEGTKKESKRMARPTDVFAKNAKKPEADDQPGRMRGAPRRKRKLAGMMI